MANYTLVPIQEETEPENEKKPSAVVETKSSTGADSKSGGAPIPIGWTVDGVPVGEPRVERAQWESGIFSCTGKNDEFYSSDVEVCLLGSVAPCVLHGSNVERLGSAPGSFTNHCLPYAGLYLLGNCFFGWNCLAPWYSYPNRTAIRHKFNLEGSCEALARTFGCSGNILMNEAQREQCESACDFVSHVFCHPCALCQEAREVRRKVPHPGFTANPVFVMLPPGTQTMARQP
ncbi:hypothetical protein ACS0TY_015912 [Phlomoides rotata]